MRNNRKARRGGTVQSFELYRVGETPPERRSRRHRWLRFASLLAVLTVVACCLRVGYDHYMRSAYPKKYSEYVDAYAKQYGFEPSLIYALIRTESGFNPDAVSSAHAMGLMQLTKETFEWAQKRSNVKETIPVNELFRPEINIHYGVLVLSLLREEFGDTRTTLAAYNAGIGNARRWLKDSTYSDDGKTLKTIPYKETRSYVEKIPRTQSIYQKLYHCR